MNTRSLLLFALTVAAGLSRAEDVQLAAPGRFIAPATNTAAGAPVPADAESALAQLARTLQVEKHADGTFAIGAVTFDKQKRTVTLPAAVNMREDLIEYALVTDDGKRHESLLTTAVRPEQVHLACLLLGQRPAPLRGEVGGKAPAVPTAEQVQVRVSWDRNGGPAEHALADLLMQREYDLKGGPGPLRPVTNVVWQYNGSAFDAYGFQAGREGSIIALIRDDTALINNAGPDRDDDEIHRPYTDRLPATGLPVRVTLQLSPAP